MPEVIFAGPEGRLEGRYHPRAEKDAPIALIELGDPAKMILIGAMVLGRLETLAIIALLTPDLWRA